MDEVFWLDEFGWVDDVYGNVEYFDLLCMFELWVVDWYCVVGWGEDYVEEVLVFEDFVELVVIFDFDGVVEIFEVWENLCVVVGFVEDVEVFGWVCDVGIGWECIGVGEKEG